MALPATDAFTDTNGTALESHDANWTMIGTGGNSSSWAINTNAAYPDSTTSNFARWDGDTFGDDQYSQAVLAAIDAAGSGRFGLAVRITSPGADTADKDGYCFAVRNWSGNEARYLYSVTDASETILDSDGTASSTSEVLRIEANGTTIRALVDDVEILSATDSTHTSGSAGLYANNKSTSDCRLDDWEGGNLGTGTGTSTIALAMHHYTKNLA